MALRATACLIRAVTAFIVMAFLGIHSAAAESDQRLVEAVKRSDVATVRGLLRGRVDINVPDRDGSTPLLWAVNLGHHELVTLLLASGADVKTANAYGVTPLYQASTQ